MAIARRDDDDIPGFCGNQHDIVKTPCLENVVGLPFKHLVDLRIAGSLRIFGVEVSLRFDAFPAETPCRDDGKVIPQVLLVQPGTILIGTGKIPVHEIERFAAHA